MALLTILFLAGLFTDLPEAILGAIVIWAVSGMIDFGRVTQYWRAQSLEFWAALGALLGVILIDILPGVAIGVALSFILLIHTIDHPRAARRLASVEDDPAATPPGADPSLRGGAASPTPLQDDPGPLATCQGRHPRPPLVLTILTPSMMLILLGLLFTLAPRSLIEEGARPTAQPSESRPRGRRRA